MFFFHQREPPGRLMTDSIPGERLTWTQVWEEGLGELFWDKKVGTLWCLWQ